MKLNIRQKAFFLPKTTPLHSFLQPEPKFSLVLVPSCSSSTFNQILLNVVYVDEWRSKTSGVEATEIDTLEKIWIELVLDRT